MHQYNTSKLLFLFYKVYKRKTEAAKKEYLKALAAYRANQLSQVTSCCLWKKTSPLLCFLGLTFLVHLIWLHSSLLPRRWKLPPRHLHLWLTRLLLPFPLLVTREPVWQTAPWKRTPLLTSVPPTSSWTSQRWPHVPARGQTKFLLQQLQSLRPRPSPRS